MRPQLPLLILCSKQNWRNIFCFLLRTFFKSNYYNDFSHGSMKTSFMVGIKCLLEASHGASCEFFK